MFPINFVVGAAVGAAATYVFKDDSAKQWLSDTGVKLKEGARSLTSSFKKQPPEQADDTIVAVETAEAAETVEVAEVVQEESTTTAKQADTASKKAKA